MLEVFTTERNSFAPIIYKTLTFYLVENYSDEIVREFILNNFNILFDTQQMIPVGILLEPLVKQIQVASNLKFNTIDFDFFIRVAKHSKLTMKYAVQTMDALGKIYMNEKHFSRSAGIPFMVIATRFIEGSSVREYLYRFVKYSLKLTYKYETKVFDKTLNLTNESDSNLKFQRDIMLDLSQKIIKLRNEYLTDRIIKELCDSNTLIKKKIGNNSKAIIILLKLLGDPRELLDLYSSQSENLEKNLSGDDEIVIKDLHRKDVKKDKFGSESSTTSLNSMNLMPRGRVGRTLEKIRQDLIEKDLELKLKAEKSKISLENRKRILRKQVEQRRIELGVSSKSDLERKNDEVRVDNQIIKEFTSNEKETISFVLKRYQRVLRLLFKKYSSTGYKHSIVSKETFESLAEKSSLLSDSEFYRLLKEQGVTTAMITIEEFSQLMKNYCHQKKKPQLKVNFFEFSELLTQTAVFIYSKPQNDFSHLPPAVSLKFLFEYFRKLSTGKGISRKFYDEPDPGVGDKEVVKRLNLLLEKDPETPIPEGFKKIVENDIELVYDVPSSLGISESQSVGISILDGILEKCLGIHILEPLILVKSITRAIGILSKPQVAGESEKGSVIGTKFNMSQMGITYHKAVYQPSLPTDLNLTAGIKFEIARLTGKVPNDALYESAQLLDDLLYTVDVGSSILISRNNKQKIINKAQFLKELTVNQKKIEDHKKEERRKMRAQIIEEKLKNASANKENKMKEEAAKKKAEEARKKEIAKKNEEKRNEEKKKKDNEVHEWKLKKKEENQKI